MAAQISFLLIVLPFIAAAACYLIRSEKIQNLIVLANCAVLAAAAVTLYFLMPFSFSPGRLLGVGVPVIIAAADFLSLLLIFYLGYRHHNRTVMIVSGMQVILLFYLEFFIPGHATRPAIVCDPLALVMVLIISIIGSIIVVQSIAYLKNHETHLHLAKTKRHRFYLVMLMFLGAMNGMVLADDMRFAYFFFELTTLCSFLLIAHDGSRTAIANAVRALWMNSIGGLAFLLAVVMISQASGSAYLQDLMPAGDRAMPLLLALGLLSLAAFIKSAQFPFQSWLLGAMVAPTPVSALLHSSTMVKIGVYLLLRIAPQIQGTLLSQSIAVYGAFTFLAAAGLAVGQSNGKKVLAYSTISNLGLIVCCAGLNLSGAITAAVVLILFHAVTKALLFLCVGTIEQHIASRDIEDMRGVYARMPLTALITVMGIITMIMPPFGLLLGKWMAMEAASHNLLTIFMIALGSALTTMYWARWAGTLMSDPFAGKFSPERQPVLTWLALGSLAAAAFILSVGSPLLYRQLLVAVVTLNYNPFYGAAGGVMQSASGAFAVVPLSLVAGLGFFFSILAVRRAKQARFVAPYLSGAQTTERSVFLGPINQPVHTEASNYYLASLFGEKKLTTWVNLAAGVLLLLILGGTL